MKTKYNTEFNRTSAPLGFRSYGAAKKATQSKKVSVTHASPQMQRLIDAPRANPYELENAALAAQTMSAERKLFLARVKAQVKWDRAESEYKERKE